MWDAISLLLPYQIGSGPAPPRAAPSNICELSQKGIARWNSTRSISSSTAKFVFLTSSDIFFIVEMSNSRPPATLPHVAPVSLLFTNNSTYKYIALASKECNQLFVNVLTF